jgi:hypothetical protein
MKKTYQSVWVRDLAITSKGLKACWRQSKATLLILFAGIAFLLSAGTSSAHAQTDAIETASVPFDFHAGDQKMPAETYYFGLDPESQIVTLQDAAGKHRVFLPAPSFEQVIASARGSGHAELMFAHLGNAYYPRDLKRDALEASFPLPGLGERQRSA